jgi:hypothetical protein
MNNNSDFKTLFPKIKKSQIEAILIRAIDFSIPSDKSKYDQIVALVDQILAAKAANPAADTTALESEIDQLIYQLYGLTAEEIAIVEGRSA